MRWEWRSTRGSPRNTSSLQTAAWLGRCFIDHVVGYFQGQPRTISSLATAKIDTYSGHSKFEASLLI